MSDNIQLNRRPVEHELGNEDEERQIDAELEIERHNYDQLKARVNELETEVAEENAALAATNPQTVETLRQLLEERDEAKHVESSFKRDCRAHLETLDQQLEALRRQQMDNLVETDLFLKESTTAKDLRQLETQLNELVGQLKVLNNDIYHLEKKVERCSSQIELNQYQRRFIELYDQGKHRETKRYYTMHNALIDVRNFVKREIDLLNNIDDSRNLALRDGYKDLFVENLQNICWSIEQNLDKVLCGKRNVQEERDALADQLQLLIDKQRLYMKTVVEFQMECKRNESLRATSDAS